MDSTIQKKIDELEKFIGFPIERRTVKLSQNEPHDETLSYNLSLRFYNNNEELEKGIGETLNVLMALIKEIKKSKDPLLVERIGIFYSLLGNMYYLLEDYGLCAGYFMKAVSLNKDDITPWIELLFSLRAIGEFELFEKGIFNFDDLVNLWKDDPYQILTQEKALELLRKAEV